MLPNPNTIATSTAEVKAVLLNKVISSNGDLARNCKVMNSPVQKAAIKARITIVFEDQP